MRLEEWLKTELQQDIWKRKYQYNNETLEQFFDRISGGNQEVRALMIDKKFLPGGRILANRGLHKEGKKITLSNCYVISPPEDNLESIFDCAKKLARTFSYGGGCGIDISKLSPRGATINNAAKNTTGAVSFMDLYSLTTELIGQSGRRGALMLSIDCSHPDLEEFIDIKNDLNKVTKANISIRLTDNFMRAVRDNQEYTLSFTRKETGEKIEKVVNARELFNKIAKSNWSMAEPGALFWSRIDNWNLLSEDENFEYAGVNPCAEEPLPAGGSCLLGSINLAEFVIDPFTDKAKFDTVEFSNAVKKVTVFMNDLLDEGLSLHPLEEQIKSVGDWRQIGIGIMGLADMLIKLGIKYGSKLSIDVCNTIANTMIRSTLNQSCELAKKYGAYPMFNKEAVLKSPFLRYNANPELIEKISEYGLRNSQLLTIAPTGSLSTMLGISGGIEPIFNISYTRKTLSLHDNEKEYKVYTPIAEQYMAIKGIKKEEDLPDIFVTAMTLNHIERIDMQAVWQKCIDASISSTVNVPEDFSVENTEKLYLYAWEKGLKGVTIYRDNCARSGILVNDKKKEETPKLETELKRGMIIDVSDDVIGKKKKLTTGCGNLHLVTFFDPVSGDLMETYLAKGSTGGCNNFMIGLSRMISLCARAGIGVKDIVDQLNSSGACPSYAIRTATKRDTSKGSCCPVAIGKALLELQEEVYDELGFNEDYTEAKTNNKKAKDVLKCPSCGEALIPESGCFSCVHCGYSKCG